MTDNVMETHNLTFYYGKKKVVDSVNFAVPRGSILALLGRNGSGKTTTIRMLLGLLEPTRGSSTVLGRDSQRLGADELGRIGYMNERHKVYGWMRVSELERYQSSFYPKWDANAFQIVLDHFAIGRRSRALKMSRGQRTGLALALALAQSPELLVLDDPALGLDAVVRRSLMEAMVYITRDSNRTILFSSHILTEVERVADRVAILDRGVLRACCDLDIFRERVRRVSLRIERPPDRLDELPGLLGRSMIDDCLVLTIANWGETVERAVREMAPEGVEIESEPLSLEEAFIAYVEQRGGGAFLLNSLEGGAS